MNVFQVGCKPQRILDAVSASRIVHPGGGFSPLDGLSGEKWTHLVASYIVDDRHPLERLKAVSRIINTQQAWTPDTFSKAYQRAAEEISNTRTSYICVLPLTGSRDLIELLRGQLASHQRILAEPLTKRETRISRERERLKRLIDFRDMLDHALHHIQDAEIHIKVKGSSPAHAQDIANNQAMEAIGLNAFASNFTIGRSYSGIHQPIGELLIAPFTTIHDLSGRLAAEIFWYGAWSGPHSGGGPSKRHMESHRTRVKLYTESLSRSYWKDSCKRLLQMYYTFISEPDRNSAFLAGWNILEFLLSDIDRDSLKTAYDVIIKRACCFYRDRERAEVTGLYIKNTRNKIAHGHDAPLFDSSETLYALMNFIRPVMRAFIVNHYRLRTRSEFLAFCDLSAHEVTLDERLARAHREIRVIEAARTFTCQTHV